MDRSWEVEVKPLVYGENPLKGPMNISTTGGFECALCGHKEMDKSMCVKGQWVDFSGNLKIPLHYVAAVRLEGRRVQTITTTNAAPKRNSTEPGYW